MTTKAERLRVAVSTESDKGIKDKVSHGFGRSKTFTILDIENGKIKKVEIIPNPAESANHGRDPILAKHLADMNVEMLIASEVGPGASAMLRVYGVQVLKVASGKTVYEALKGNSLIS
ncbi:MAG: NifB/NifX family molybdenum-iron cluster-binding protein [Candidatus Bathyarchaeales archaeon]